MKDITTFRINRFIMRTFLVVAVLALLPFIQNMAHAQLEAGVRVETATKAEVGVQEEPVFCTADAYQCPNGDWVGRSGPDCEFVCSDDSSDEVNESDENEDLENDSGRNNDNRNMPGMRLAPSQPRVIVMPATDSSNDTNSLIGELEGLEVDFHDVDSDGDGLGDAELSGSGAVTVKVDGAMVRGWNPEKKEAVRARLMESNDRNDANDFGLSVAMQAINHDEIRNIKVKENSATIIFETELKILGFIPAKATVETTAQNSGEVTTSYPWWRFLAKTSQKDRVDIFTNIATNLAARIAIDEGSNS